MSLGNLPLPFQMERGLGLARAVIQMAHNWHSGVRLEMRELSTGSFSKLIIKSSLLKMIRNGTGTLRVWSQFK